MYKCYLTWYWCFINGSQNSTCPNRHHKIYQYDMTVTLNLYSRINKVQFFKTLHKIWFIDVVNKNTSRAPKMSLCGILFSLMETTHLIQRYILCSWWRHQMETFSALLAICAGNSPVPGEFPTQGQWRGALMFSLICVWINSCVNNREAGDLRRYRAHDDVTV